MDKGIFTFPEGISPKVDFELSYYDVFVQPVSHFTQRTPNPFKMQANTENTVMITIKHLQIKKNFSIKLTYKKLICY